MNNKRIMLGVTAAALAWLCGMCECVSGAVKLSECRVCMHVALCTMLP
jgi:hypothetical protein